MKGCYHGENLQTLLLSYILYDKNSVPVQFEPEFYGLLPDIIPVRLSQIAIAFDSL